MPLESDKAGVSAKADGEKPAGTVESGSGVAAVERALSVMQVFQTNPGPLTLTQLARAAGLYPSTTLRMLASLERAGFIARAPGGAYLPGPALFRLGNVYLSALRLEDRVVPVLKTMSARTGESASFYVRHGDHRMCLLRVDGSRMVIERVKQGDLLPLNVGAPGHVIRAFEGAAGEALDQVRQSFHSVSLGEWTPDLGAVAAPVFGANDELIGALCISGPLTHFTDDSTAWMIRVLMAAAIDVTAAVGGDETRLPALERLATLPRAR